MTAKLKVRWQPSDSFRADFIYEYIDDDSPPLQMRTKHPPVKAYVLPIIGFPGIQQAGWNDPLPHRAVMAATQGDQSGRRAPVDANGPYLTMTWSFDNYLLKSITGYRTRTKLWPAPTPESLHLPVQRQQEHQAEAVQQELQIDGVNSMGRSTSWPAPPTYVEDVEFVVFGNLGFFLPLARRRILPRDVRSTVDRQRPGSGSAFYLDGTYELTEKQA